MHFQQTEGGHNVILYANRRSCSKVTAQVKRHSGAGRCSCKDMGLIGTDIPGIH